MGGDFTLRDVLLILQGRESSVMKWEDVCRSPYRTKEEADAAEAKLAPIREARAQADHARKEAVREARYAAMLERQRAERNEAPRVSRRLQHWRMEP